MGYASGKLPNGRQSVCVAKLVLKDGFVSLGFSPLDDQTDLARHVIDQIPFLLEEGTFVEVGFLLSIGDFDCAAPFATNI